MLTSCDLMRAIGVSAILMTAGCGSASYPSSPSPAPVGDPPTANVYILPGAVNLGANAFGDETVVIYRGERMRLRNIDTVEHNVVPDTPSVPEFVGTGLLSPGAERSFVMNSTGTTTFHCTIHPQMVGTLTVRDR